MFLNHLLDFIDLTQDDDLAGPAATAQLVVDMAGQQVRNCLAMSFRTVSLRRENACAYFREEFGKDLSSDLSALKFSDKHVFGGEFAKTVRKLAKKIRDKQTLESDLAAIPSKGKGRGSSWTWKPSADTPQPPSRVGRGRGTAGRGRKRSRSRQSNRSTPAAAGAPPKAKRGRGRGGRATQQRI